ncbi:MAG: hypothetical protein K2N18_00635 [Clostridia bacterium]|nr:hypothetical protein [Clostridia bacterium]
MNLASYLADNSDFDVYYVNNYFQQDSKHYFSSKLKNYTPDSFDYSLSSDVVFFTPVNYLMHLLVRIKDYPYARICLYQYSVQAVNWLRHNMSYTCSSEEIEGFLNGYSARAYMNSACLGQNALNAELDDKVYLPIVMSETYQSDYSVESVIDNDRINIGYLGALNSESICLLYNLFSNLSAANNDKKTDIHVIGRAKLSLNSGFKKSSSNLARVIFTGDIDAESRKNYIRKNIDILIASKNNAIEGAACGVPVVVPVCDNKPFVGNNYVYLFDIKGYRYSFDYSGLLESGSRSCKFDKILNDVYIRHEKCELARACYDYCLENNSLKVVAERFINLISNSDLYVKDCLCERGFTNSIKLYEDYAKANDCNGYGQYLKEKSVTPKK